VELPELHNLYVAGDYCRSAIDLVSMEGAVSTGLLAAEAVRADAELPREVEILIPETPPRWLLVLGRVTLLPLALIAKLWTMVTDRGEGGDDERQRRQHQTQRGLDEQRAGGGEKGERKSAAGGAAQAQRALDGGAGGLEQKEGEHREPNPKARSR
jgi:hypothetical protein